MNLEKAAAKLTALATDASARSKTAQLLDVLPYVERALAAGVTHSKILEALKESGLELKPKAFASALLRLRARATPAAKLPASRPAVDAPAAQSPSIPAAAQPSSTGATRHVPAPPAPSQGPAPVPATRTPRPSLEEILARQPNVTELEQRARRRARQERQTGSSTP